MQLRTSKNYKFMKDVVLNIISSTMVIAIMQFFVYPLLSRKLENTHFGEVLTIIGIVNIVAVMFGNSLNNLRLIVNNEYKEYGVNGDFLPLLGIASVINILIMFYVTLFLNHNTSLFDVFLLTLVSLLTMIRAYLGVAYRIKIDYLMFFFYNLSGCIGYILGIGLAWLTDVWQLVFVCGEGIGFLFAIYTTDLLKESRKITTRFKATAKRYIYLSISSMISNILIYLDRLLILPFLGGEQVSVYYTASVFGKLVSLIIQPTSGVMLSYFSNSTRKMRVNEFWYINLILIVLSGISYIGCLFLSPIFTRILYPTLFEEATSLLPLANLAAIISATSMITQSIILKYSPTGWQLVIQVIYGMLYLCGGLLLIHINGLVGFCIASIIAGIVRFLLMCVIGTVSLAKS
jgi:O-antigen/teichoic acid export membrane protein